MKSKLCLFCNRNGHKTGADYICSTCVQLLLMTSQEVLKNSYSESVEKGFENKAWAIKSFLKKEIEYEQQKPKSKKRVRYPNRKRIVRPVRNKKKRFGRAAV